MSNAAHRYKIVVYIDCETTYSGYAYSYQDDKETIHVKSNWFSGSSLWKVPTVILFDDKYKFLAFGEKAENMYNQYAECEEEHKYLYFDRFKMMLYNKEVTSCSYCNICFLFFNLSLKDGKAQQNSVSITL